MATGSIAETEKGERETFVLYSVDRAILKRRHKALLAGNPEATISHAIRDIIRSSETTDAAK